MQTIEKLVMQWPRCMEDGLNLRAQLTVWQEILAQMGYTLSIKETVVSEDANYKDVDVTYSASKDSETYEYTYRKKVSKGWEF